MRNKLKYLCPMPKRFTDTNKWKDSWFQDLPSKYKLFWIYLLDECDSAGVWKPNIRLATFQIGEPFEEAELKRVFGERITVTETGYWFITKFIGFQYGELSDTCKPHVSVINILKNHKIKGYSKGIDTLKDKEKDKEQEQDKEIKDQIWFEKQIDPIYLERMKMNHRGKDVTRAMIDSFSYLLADPVRLNNADSAECKRLLNTWLGNQKTNRKDNGLKI